MPRFDWLQCDITDGMFSDEKIIEVADQEGTCFVVPASEVDEHKSAVRVFVAEIDGREFAVLPTNRRDLVRWGVGNRVPA